MLVCWSIDWCSNWPSPPLCDPQRAGNWVLWWGLFMDQSCTQVSLVSVSLRNLLCIRVTVHPWFILMLCWPSVSALWHFHWYEAPKAQFEFLLLSLPEPPPLIISIHDPAWICCLLSMLPPFLHLLLSFLPQFQGFRIPLQLQQPPQQLRRSVAPTSGVEADPSTAPSGLPCLSLPSLRTPGKRVIELYDREGDHTGSAAELQMNVRLSSDTFQTHRKSGPDV